MVSPTNKSARAIAVVVIGLIAMACAGIAILVLALFINAVSYLIHSLQALFV